MSWIGYHTPLCSTGFSNPQSIIKYEEIRGKGGRWAGVPLQALPGSLGYDNSYQYHICTAILFYSINPILTTTTASLYSGLKNSRYGSVFHGSAREVRIRVASDLDRGVLDGGGNGGDARDNGGGSGGGGDAGQF